MLRNLIKKVLTEEIRRRYRRVTPELYPIILKYIGTIFKRFNVDNYDETKTYGDYRAEFCYNGKRLGLFMGTKKDAIVLIDGKIIDEICKMFNIKRSSAAVLIGDYIEDNYVKDFNSRSKHNLTDVDNVTEHKFRGELCRSEIEKRIPNYTREQKLDWLKSTGRTTKYDVHNNRNLKFSELDDNELNDYFKDIWVIEFNNNYEYDIVEFDDEDDD